MICVWEAQGEKLKSESTRKTWSVHAAPSPRVCASCFTLLGSDGVVLGFRISGFACGCRWGLGRTSLNGLSSTSLLFPLGCELWIAAGCSLKNFFNFSICVVRCRQFLRFNGLLAILLALAGCWTGQGAFPAIWNQHPGRWYAAMMFQILCARLNPARTHPVSHVNNLVHAACTGIPP